MNCEQTSFWAEWVNTVFIPMFSWGMRCNILPSLASIRLCSPFEMAHTGGCFAATKTFETQIFSHHPPPTTSTMPDAMSFLADFAAGGESIPYVHFPAALFYNINCGEWTELILNFQIFHQFYSFNRAGISGAVAKTATAPIERVKLIIQTQDANPLIKSGEVARYTGIGDCFTRVYKEQGMKVQLHWNISYRLLKWAQVLWSSYMTNWHDDVYKNWRL